MPDHSLAQTVYACAECSAVVIGDRDAATVMMHDPRCLYLGVIWEFLVRPEAKLVVIAPTGRGIQDNDQGAYLDISIPQHKVYDQFNNVREATDNITVAFRDYVTSEGDPSRQPAE